MGKRELVALLNLSSLYLVVIDWLFLAVPWGCLLFVIVVFPDHTHLLFFTVSKAHVLLTNHFPEYINQIYRHFVRGLLDILDTHRIA